MLDSPKGKNHCCLVIECLISQALPRQTPHPQICEMEASDASKTAPAMHIEEAPSNGIAVSAKLSLWQAVRKWPKVAGYCLALTTAILLWGYDMAMVGNLASLPQFQYVFVFQR